MPRLRPVVHDERHDAINVRYRGAPEALRCFRTRSGSRWAAGRDSSSSCAPRRRRSTWSRRSLADMDFIRTFNIALVMTKSDIHLLDHDWWDQNITARAQAAASAAAAAVRTDIGRSNGRYGPDTDRRCSWARTSATEKAATEVAKDAPRRGSVVQLRGCRWHRHGVRNARGVTGPGLRLRRAIESRKERRA